MPASLNIVIQMAASLLNAAGWKNYLIGSIASGAGALTVADAAFTGDDVGKKIAIDGAGAAGAIYEGTISAVADATHVTVTPVAGTTVVGTTVSYGGRLRDDRRNLFELREAAFEADETHYLALAETTGHWLRPELLTLSTGLAHDTQLGTAIPHIGPLGRVFIRIDPLGAYQPGKRAEPEEVTRLRANTGSAPNNTYGSLAHNVAGSQIGGYYWMPEDENTVQYTGDSLKVYYVPTYTRGTALKTHEIFTGSLASQVVAQLLAKEGARTSQHATIHGGYSSAVIAGIRAQQERVPTLDEYKEETAVGREATA